MPENPMYESDAQAQPRDPRAEARETATRIAAPTSGERLHRRRRTSDPLYIDKRIIPKGFSYEWKRVEQAGKPDSVHKMEMRENHWKEVPASRHPELATAGDSIIRRGDVVLYERPKYLTDEAQMDDISEALQPVQQMEGLMFGSKPGEMTRDHPSVRKIASVRQQYAPGDPVNEGGAGEGGGLSSDP